MLGSSLLPALRAALGPVRCIDRAELNLTDPGRIEAVLEPVEFDWIINAAGYTAVDDCEVNERLAYLVNAEAPQKLAEIAAARGARLLQFSTDYVFDGGAFLPYREDDVPNPVSVYGKSKRAGEERVLAASRRHTVVRLSWLFGPGRAAFPRWVLRKALSDGCVRIVSDKSACPTFGPDLAQWVVTLLQVPTFPGGLVHACNSGVCTWMEYGEHVLRCAVASRLLPAEVPVEPVRLADLPGLIAPRPLYSALDTSLFTAITGVNPRPWQDAVADHVAALGNVQW